MFRNLTGITWRNYKYVRDDYEEKNPSTYTPVAPLTSSAKVEAAFVFDVAYNGTAWADDNEQAMTACVTSLTNQTTIMMRCYAGNSSFTTTE